MEWNEMRIGKGGMMFLPMFTSVISPAAGGGRRRKWKRRRTKGLLLNLFLLLPITLLVVVVLTTAAAQARDAVVVVHAANVDPRPEVVNSSSILLAPSSNLNKSSIRLDVMSSALTSNIHRSTLSTSLSRHKRESVHCGSGSNSTYPLETTEVAINETARLEQVKISQLLATFYRLSSSTSERQTNSSPLRDLPRPENLTVLIISWYPPILKLSWQLKDVASLKLNFFAHNNNINNSTVPPGVSTSTGAVVAAEEAEDKISSEEREALAKLSERQQLLAKALSCFQVTYNVVNSRFKIIEEYPPYRRSILLERLAPATEYSLRIRAVYLDRFVATSERVQFVSPTDNESRRFKENTYRPIHRYPDEQPTVRPVGLAQVRSEELTIVVIAVMFWIATICLFFNKWGKIRMLEPYQPAYREVEPASPTSGAFQVGPAGGSVVSAVAAGAHRGSSMHNLAAQAAAAAAAAQAGSGGSISSAGLFVACPKSGLSLEQQPAGMSQTGTGKDWKRHSSCCELTPAAGPTVLPAAARATSRQRATTTGSFGSGKLAPDQMSDQCQVQQQQPPPTTSAAPITTTTAAAAALAAAAKTNHHRPSKALALLREAQTIGSSGEFRSCKTAAGTDSELNYLFQTKALALARVTRLWSKKQQQLQQLQRYHHRPVRVSLASPPPVAVVAAAASRQTAAAANSWMMLRQRAPIRQMTSVAAPFSVTKSAELSPDNRHLQQQQQQQQQQQRQADSSQQRSLDAGSQAIRQLKYQRQPQSLLLLDGQSATVATAVRSLDRPETTRESADQRPTNDSQSSTISRTQSNRLRRLLFMSKQHQHHHVATSSSSSNLQQTQTAGSQAAKQSANQHHQQQQQQQQSASLDYQRSLDTSSHGGKGSVGDSCEATGSQPLVVQAAENRRLPVVSVSSSSLPVLEVSVNRTNAPEQEKEEEEDNGGQLDILIQPPSPPRHQLQFHRNGEQPRVCQQLNPKATAANLEQRRRSATDRTLHSRLVDQRQQQQQQQRQPVEICLQEAPDELGWQDLDEEEAKEEEEEEMGGEVGGRGDAFARLARCAARRKRLLAAAAAASCRPVGCCRLSSASSGQPGRHQSLCCDSLARQRQQQQQEQQQQQWRTWTGTYLGCGCPRSSVDLQQQQHQPHGATCEDEQAHDTQGVVLSSEARDQLGGETAPDCCSPEASRPRMSSMFVASPYSRAHRDSFAMLRALSQKKSKSAEDVAYLSSLVLQIWARDRNPLLQSVSSQQLSSSSAHEGGHRSSRKRPKRPKSSLTVYHTGYELA